MVKYLELFDNIEQQKHFEICCKAYGVDMELVTNYPTEAYESFGFVWLQNRECTIQECIEAIVDYTTIYENTTVETVAREIATNKFSEDPEFYEECGETIESITSDYINGLCDNDLFQVGNNVLYRAYC